MKKIFMLVLSITMVLGACTKELSSPMEGAWKLAYEYEVKGDQSTLIFPGESRGSEIKMWSGERWALVGVFLEDSIMTDNFGGGKFTIEGTDYQEIVEYHSAKEYLGQTVQLYLEIKDDTLTQIWPVDESGQPVKSHYFMEKWVRFE